MPLLLIPIAALLAGLYYVHKQSVAAAAAPAAAAPPTAPGGNSLLGGSALLGGTTRLGGGNPPSGPAMGGFGRMIVPEVPRVVAPSGVSVNVSTVGDAIIAQKIAQAAQSLLTTLPASFTNDPYAIKRHIAAAGLSYLAQNPSFATLQQTEKSLYGMSSPEAQATAQTLHSLFNL